MTGSPVPGSERRLEAQYAAARVLAVSTSLREAATDLLAEVSRAIGWQAADLWMRDAEDDVMRFVEMWSDGIDVGAFREQSEPMTFARGEGLPGRVWEGNEPIWIEDVRADRDFPRSRAAASCGLRGAFAFPIRLGDRVLGAISFYRSEVQAPDLALLRAMDAVGSQIGQFMERSAAIEAVRRSEARKTAILESALDAVISMDEEGRVVEFNPAAEKIFGYTRDEVLGEEMAALIIPEHLREQHRTALARYLERAEPRVLGRRVELEGMRRDGTVFPVELAITRVDVEGPPMFTGYVRDITDRIATEEALQKEENRLRQALDAGRMGAWDWDIPSGSVTWSEQLERMHDLEPGSFGGTFEAFAADMHPEDRERVLTTIEDAIGRGGSYHVEYRILLPDASIRWLEARGVVERDADGSPARMTGLCTDVTARREAEEIRLRLLEGERVAREEAEAAQERLAFLAEASSLLARSLDYEQTMEELAHLVVPRIADWCSIDVPDDGSFRQLAIAHVDPGKVELARELRRAHPPRADDPQGVAQVIRTGEPVLYPEISDDLLVAAAKDEEHLEMLRSLGMVAGMVVPLQARGRVIGALSVVSSESGRRFDERDLAFVSDLASRAAIALDNARLYQERSHIAKTLQRSLLPPELPRVPGVEVAARYAPAGEGNEVGGDFYDLFERGDDEWILAVGDVCGKGPQAAAVTGLARHTMRAASLKDGRPSRALRVLNEALIRSGSDRFCTVVAARFEWRGGLLSFTTSAAGHPLPQVLRASGVVETVGEHGTLLGVFPDPDVRDATVELGPGDAIIFYTDGVIEDRRGDTIWEKRSLRAMLQHCAFLGSADAIADCIQREVRQAHPDGPQDDIAIVVCRVAP